MKGRTRLPPCLVLLLLAGCTEPTQVAPSTDGVAPCTDDACNTFTVRVEAFRVGAGDPVAGADVAWFERGRAVMDQEWQVDVLTGEQVDLSVYRLGPDATTGGDGSAVATLPGRGTWTIAVGAQGTTVEWIELAAPYPAVVRVPLFERQLTWQDAQHVDLPLDRTVAVAQLRWSEDKALHDAYAARAWNGSLTLAWENGPYALADLSLEAGDPPIWATGGDSDLALGPQVERLDLHPVDVVPQQGTIAQGLQLYAVTDRVAVSPSMGPVKLEEDLVFGADFTFRSAPVAFR